MPGAGLMKALSLTQPWAQLMVIGVKEYDTRSWSTRYRGRLAIHAAKGFPKDARDFRKNEAACDLANSGFALGIPFGAIIGEATLVDVWTTEEIVGWWNKHNRSGGTFDYIVRRELLYGNYGGGRFAWRFSDPKIYRKPIPAKGSLGLWEWTNASQP
jgi:activating signal cointegrator 1